MSRKLINDGWKFCLTELDTGIEELEENSIFLPVNIPHDWLIYNGKDLYKNGTGWYRRELNIEKIPGHTYEIYFEGVYMDSKVYLNGELIGEWKYGYSSFFFDMTDSLESGSNTLLVRVDYQSPNSRWYSGAGIYRNVYLSDYQKIHFVTDSLYVSAKSISDNLAKWKIQVSVEIAGGTIADAMKTKFEFAGNTLQLISAEKVSAEAGNISAEAETISAEAENISAEAENIGTLTQACIITVKYEAEAENPLLWSPDDPNLYTCTASLENGESVSSVFGFRQFTYDCEHGMFVNGKHVKIYGVCEHHDLGALGAAFYKNAMRRKLEILRSMGVNAIRTSHNMPAPGLLELTDEMGFLVMDEAFDMWESCKTTYDYGRFFKEWQKKDVHSWIRRDRNHPSIFMWSIGNEIYDTHKDAHGVEITKMLQSEAKELDPWENAVIGIGSNFMPWEGAQNCADVLKFAGYNYGEKYYDDHHAAHPDWHIFGSETASTVQSRGIYHFPLKQPVLADDDMQCSSLGNSSTSWGAKNPESIIVHERDREYSLGQFLWTGFDYIGEPTPYQTRNSYFGQIDTAGFAKDSYYIYKAGWTDYKKDPFVHVFPYWDFNEGQLIDVRVASNAPCVELMVNGVSKGRKKIDVLKGSSFTGDWNIPYEKGCITGIAYDENGNEIARQERHSFGEAAKLVIKECKVGRTLTAGCGDVAFAEIYAVDKDGYPVENACNSVSVSVKGAGWLAGLDNGDSTDSDEYKGDCRRLFSGKLLAVIAIGADTGKIVVNAESEGLENASLELEVKAKEDISGISLIPENEVLRIGKNKSDERKSDERKSGNERKSDNKRTDDEKTEDEKSDDFNGIRRGIRKIELTCDGSTCINKENSRVIVRAKVLPEELESFISPADLNWKAVTDSGIISPIAKVERLDDFSAAVTAFGDGQIRLRCSCNDGCEMAKVISQLDFEAEGLGEALLDPYGFIAGGLYSYSEGTMGSGNDHGVATPRGERAVVGFEKIDFGSYGSDEIEIALFVLSSAPFPFKIWEGIPGEKGSRMLADVVYQKEMKWNVYQPETFKLSERVKGISTICFETYDKAHIGGFSFKKKVKAYELLSGGECDSIYGDSFKVDGKIIRDIGNNVTVEFADMDFGDTPAMAAEITGKTANSVNTIHLLWESGGERIREIADFDGNGERTQKFEFAGTGFKGKGTLRLVFLPGSSFELESIRFIKA